MVIPYENFISMINDCETLINETLEASQLLLDSCYNFSSEVGDKISQACNNRIQIKKNEGTLNWKSRVGYTAGDIVSNAIIMGIGQLIGMKKAKKNEEKIKKEIIENCRPLERRFNNLYPTLKGALKRQLDFQQELAELDYSTVYSLLLSKNDIDKKKSQNIIEKHLTSFYKISYWHNQGKQLSYFFNNYVTMLDNFEAFSEWLSENLLIDESDYYETVVSYFKNDLYKFDLESNEAIDSVNKIWEQFLISRPNLAIEEKDYNTSTNLEQNIDYQNNNSESNDFKIIKDENGRCTSFSVV